MLLPSGLCGVSEKEKWDVEEKKMTEMICHRDGRIEELERRCTQQSDEISHLTARFGHRLVIAVNSATLHCLLCKVFINIIFHNGTFPFFYQLLLLIGR